MVEIPFARLDELNQTWDDIEAALLATQAAQQAAETAQQNAETAEQNAETAQQNAETAEQGAVAAQGLAEAAQLAAENARDAAVIAQQAAELAETNAETAKTNAETAETNAEAAQLAAENARDAALQAKTDAETAETNAETAETNAEAAQLAAENARDAALQAKTDAETAETNAEAAQLAAENARDAALVAQQDAEAAKADAETAETNAINAASSASSSLASFIANAEDFVASSWGALPLKPSVYADWSTFPWLASNFSFTRTSSGTYFDKAGVLKTAGSGDPRFHTDYATGETGLLVEGQRTNLIRNNTMQGAAAGTPGTTPTNWNVSGSANGLSREIVGTGTENGIEYIDIKVSGTASADGAFTIYCEDSITISASKDQVFTMSMFASLIGGSLSNIVYNRFTLSERGAGGSFVVNQYDPVTITAGRLQRYSVTKTISSNDTQFVTGGLVIGYLNGQTYDFTLRIGLPQIELAAFPSSPIKTSGSQVTRAADSLTRNNADGVINLEESTLFVEMMGPNTATSTTHGGLMLHDGTNNERLLVGITNNSAYGYVIDGGSQQAGMSLGSIALGKPARIALAAKKDDCAACFNGGAVSTDTSASMPTVTQFAIGQGGVGNLHTFGIIKHIAYWPRRLTNEQLQAITSRIGYFLDPVAGKLYPVTIGDANSGGSGYRLLRVPNTA